MSFDGDDYDLARENIQDGHGTEEFAPTSDQKLGWFTLISLPLNRTIGSGIFVTPAIVLRGTGSVGGALVLWTAGAIIATSGLLVWLEFGLSVPRKWVTSTLKTSVPRSGGEKNYLEYMFPYRLTTCMYGIVFIILGNLAGNAIAFGIYVMSAAGQDDPSRGWVILIAIGALSLACLIHIASRRGGIILNNFFAVVKVGILISIIVLGFIRSGGYKFGGHANPDDYPTHNLDPDQSFKGDGQSIISFSDALLFIVYTYSGFEQPFYVLSEIKAPRRRFPKFTLLAMLITTILFILVNVAYLCAVPKEQVLESSLDLATLFSRDIFGEGAAPKVMASLIAFCIFGNLVVMTFTASRVKQEIAKEGILPFSLWFATGRTTFIARIWARMRKQPSAQTAADHLEETPIAALGLQWLSSMVLIGITSFLKPKTAYNVLISLYSYVMIVLVGFIVSGSLLFLHVYTPRDWTHRANFRPLGRYPVHAILYWTLCGFLLVAAFVSPDNSSPFAERQTGIPSYVIPTIGISALLWGVIWWTGLWIRGRSLKRKLKVTRVPNIVPDEDDAGQYIMMSEIVDHAWLVPEPTSETSSERGVHKLRTRDNAE